jgi:hypothetical protein
VSTTLSGFRLDRRTRVPAPRFVGNEHRRRPVVAVGSVALITICIALFTSVYLHAGNRVAVLIMARDVQQGHTIKGDDLAVVKIAFSTGIVPIAANHASLVVGRTAAVPLLHGTLLSSAELTSRRGPVRGQAVVGVATKAGQLPAGGVAVGDTVDVILTGSPSTLTGGSTGGSATTNSSPDAGQLEIGGVLAPDATVTGVAGPSASSPDTIVISVLVPTAMAPLVASASAAGQAALVLVGSSS